MNSRREFIARGCQLAAVAALPVSALAALPEVAEAHACSARMSLTGVWQFQWDPDRTGETKLWRQPTAGLYGNRKPSWTVLRYESSPIESLAVEGSAKEFTIRVRTRKTAPRYTLEGCKLQAVLYGYSEIPLERYEAPLPRLATKQKSPSSGRKGVGARGIRCSASHGIFGFREELDTLRAPARSWKIRYAASSGTLGPAPPSGDLV